MTAEVTVQRIPVLFEAAVRDFDDSPMVEIGEIDIDLDDDLDGDVPDDRERIGREPAAALSWLLDPIGGMWPLLQAGAATVLSGGIDVDEISSSRYRLRWTVTIQLREVAAFRRIALDACPADDTAARAEITASLAAAWQRAASPFTPLHRIPGITWSPVKTVVTQVFARSRRAASTG